MWLGNKIFVVVLVLLVLTGGTAYAANNSDLTQQINTGTFAVDILDENRAPVGSPSVALSTKTFSFSCQSGGSASTGTLGSNTQRLYAINPDAADAGWNITIAATGANTSVWENAGATQTFDFNDPGGSGCTDGADADSRGGQLTIDPNAGTLTADCLSCTNSNITKGSSASFSQGVTDSITLLTAAAGSDDVWRGYLTGVTLSQTIPAEQTADSYDINLTITFTTN